MTSRPYQLQTLVIGDDPASWTAAGFTVAGDTTRIANTTIRLVGPDEGRGILRAGVDGVDGEIDGMPFGGTDTGDTAPTVVHSNSVDGFDHLVAMSPAMDRTTAALLDAGLEHRRTRTFDANERTMRQSFFWLGDVILELAGSDDGDDEGPATLWGLALTSSDLARAALVLGDALGAVKPAVQKGRDIATIRTRDLDISVPIALMSPHPARDT